MRASITPDNQPSTLAEMMTLRDADKNRFDSAEKISLEGSAPDKAELIQILTMYSSKDLFLYAEKSSELRTLFAINSAMQAELSRRLQRWECAYEDCAPISSGPGLTILDLFLGAVLMTEFDRCEEYYNLLPHSAMELLNKACAYGSYQALNCRIEMNIGLLDNVLTDENEEQVDQFMHIAKLITNDANRLGNLYR